MVAPLARRAPLIAWRSPRVTPAVHAEGSGEALVETSVGKRCKQHVAACWCFLSHAVATVQIQRNDAVTTGLQVAVASVRGCVLHLSLCAPVDGVSRIRRTHRPEVRA